MGPSGEPGRAAPADQFGYEDHVDLAGLRQRQDLASDGMDRHFYELCAFAELRDRLRAGDIHKLVKNVVK